MVLKIVVLPFFEGEGGRGGLDHAFFLYSSCCSCVCVGGGRENNNCQPVLGWGGGAQKGQP